MSGFQWDNERSDIQLAHDKAVQQARENQVRDQMQSMDLPLPQYGGSDATPITQIVRDMIQNNQMRSLWFKQQVAWDVETLSDAVDEACISLGLSSEDYAPFANVSFDQIEICLQ